MDLTININGTDKSSLISWESLRIVDAVNDTANTCSFDIKIHTGQTYKPEILDTIEILDGTEKIFSGKITGISDRADGLVITQTITAKDWTSELDRVTVTERYKDMTVGEIIADLIATVLAGTGVTGTNIDCSIEVSSIAFNSIAVTKAIQTLAEQVNYSWYIDYDKDIHFFAKNTELAPFNLDDTSGNFVWDSLELDNDISQLRNVVIIRGGDKTSTTVCSKFHTGDGSQTTFNTDYKYANKPTVTVNGVSMTVGIDNIDSDADYDCLWNYEQKYIRFVTAPADEAAIQIAGYPLVPIVVQVEDVASISKYGRYEFKKIDKSIKTAEEAKQYAEAQLEAYGKSIREGSFTTYRSGLKSGQTININIISRSISESFIIQRVSLSPMSQSEGEWSIELATMRSIGIVSFLQSLLLGDSKTITVDDNEVLEKYLQDTQEVAVGEEIKILSPEEDFAEIGVGEDVVKDPFGVGVMPEYVFSPYMPESNTDPLREAYFDRATFSE